MYFSIPVSPSKRLLQEGRALRRDQVQEMHAAAEVHRVSHEHVRVLLRKHARLENPVENKCNRSGGAPRTAKRQLVLLCIFSCAYNRRHPTKNEKTLFCGQKLVSRKTFVSVPPRTPVAWCHFEQETNPRHLHEHALQSPDGQNADTKKGTPKL